MINYGIDKTVVKNFRVKEINWDRLLNNNTEYVKVVKDTSTKDKIVPKYFIDKDLKDNFETIYINDNGNMFNTILIGAKKIGESGILQYGILDLSIAQKAQNNLIALSKNAYIQRVEQIFRYIEERYGIMCNTSELKWDRVELNTTIQLNNDFTEYLRALKILMCIAPSRYKNKNMIHMDKNNFATTFVVGNGSAEIKMYNKSKQLQEVYGLDNTDNLLRVEYTLKTEKKVKDTFGTNLIKDIEDKQIKEFIQQQFNRDFIDRYNKIFKDSQKQLLNIAKEYKEKYKRTWVNKYITTLAQREIAKGVPILIDTEQLREVLKEVDKLNYSRTFKRLKTDKELIGFNNINDKIMEIFNKINDLKLEEK